MINNSFSAIILLYHGVTESLSYGIENFSRKHLSKEEFEKQMHYLKKNATPFILRDIAERLKESKSLPDRAVAVTFDDTFKNIHDVALPVLKRYQIPATFFISTGFINSNRRFWVDKVEHMINMTKHKNIEVSINNKKKHYCLLEPADKISAVIEIKKALKRMQINKRNQSLLVLRKSTQVTDNGDTVPNYTNLNWDDIRELDNPPLYEIGGHTVNHEILSYLNDKSLQYEITECIRTLESHLGHSIDLFSYPEGQPEHFDERVISALKKAKIKICPTAIKGSNETATDPFRLKRIMVGFMGEKFPFDDFENQVN